MVNKQQRKVSMRVGNLRLRKLADFLDKVPEYEFDYSTWSKGNLFKYWGEGYINAFMKRKITTCGTTACALGWAATMPYFNRLGLSPTVTGTPMCSDKSGTVRIGPFESAVKIFGLDFMEARFLFSPDADHDGRHSPRARASAKEVANHIRKFVEERNAKHESK